MISRLSATLLVLCAIHPVAAEPPKVTKENVSTFYTGLKRLTPQPKVIMGDLLLLCRDVSAEIKAKRDTFGPHAAHSINTFADTTAIAGWGDTQKPFPAGSVIVKEKLQRDRKTVAGVGGMIKRDKGYDPEHGDWEFFYWDKDVGFSTGRLAKCAECHAKARASDFVYSRTDLKAAAAR